MFLRPAMLIGSLALCGLAGACDGASDGMVGNADATVLGDDLDGDTDDGDPEVALTPPDIEAGEVSGPDPDVADGPCDPVARTGCPEDATCTYIALADPDPVCAPAGTAPYGEACSADDPCAAGICLALNDAAALCYRFCAAPEEGSAEAEAGETGCPDAAACLALDNAQYRICEIPGVYATCDLLDPVQCPADQGCYRIASEVEPVCLPSGSALVGDPCDTANGCVAGLACVDTLCRPLCDITAATPCADEGASCEPYFEGGVGYCE